MEVTKPQLCVTVVTICTVYGKVVYNKAAMNHLANLEDCFTMNNGLICHEQYK